MVVCEFFLSALVIFIISLKEDHKPIWRVVVPIVALVGSVMGFIWVAELFHKHRNPDFEWEDWKVKGD